MPTLKGAMVHDTEGVQPPEGRDEPATGNGRPPPVGLTDGTWVFVAPWSPPWKALARQLRDDLDGGRIHVVDIDERPEVADRWVIRVVPTVLVVRDGREAQRFVGALSPGRLRRLCGLSS